MKVEERWWPGYCSSKLCPGQIVDVNLDCSDGKYFILQLDGDEFTYGM
jgi:hypothetical protein